jgi:hypothetical protein
MTQDDKRAFQSMMITVMALYYKPSLDKDALRVWWQKLERFDFNTVTKAFNAFTDTPNKPPTPADIIELCKLSEARNIVPKLVNKITPEKRVENQIRLREILSKLEIKRIQ